MLDHQGEISFPSKAAREPVHISIVISYSRAYDAADAMYNDDLVTASSAQIQISIMLN